MSKTIWYGQTYLEDKPPQPPKVSLFVTIFDRTTDKNHRPVLRYKRDVWQYDSKEDMVADIVEKRMRELPAEADGNPRYIPPELKIKYASVREVKNL